MHQNAQYRRVDYANNKHHVETLRSKIDPRLIDQIEISQNPSQNYMNAFKAVYHDELEKTIQYERQKKSRQIYAPYAYSPEKEHSLPNCKSEQSFSSQGQLNKSNSINKGIFTDYNEQRQQKFDTLINKSINMGHTFFKEQDQYQQKRSYERLANKKQLQQQIKLHQLMGLQSIRDNCKESQVMKQNRVRQLQLEDQRNNQKRQQIHTLTEQLKQQMQIQRINRGRKSIFNYQNIARHNPITNPIQYHIDNPYILNKFQRKMYGQD